MRLALIAMALASLVLAGSVRSQDAPLSWGTPRPASAEEAVAVREVIGGEIAALRRGDGAGAFARAAPNIRRRFQSADAFMRMVRTDYPALLQADAPRFGTLKAAGATATQGDTFSQSVEIMDEQGEPVTAVFGLERQDDGAMRITNCVLVSRRPGTV